MPPCVNNCITLYLQLVNMHANYVIMLVVQTPSQYTVLVLVKEVDMFCWMTCYVTGLRILYYPVEVVQA